MRRSGNVSAIALSIFPVTWLFRSSWFLLLALAGVALAHEPGGRALYLGNSGVLVTACDVKVVFDAFYSDSYGQYALVPDRMSDDLMAGRPPYDGIDAVFVSHVHGDHFTAAPTLAYLRAHPDVRLFAPRQVAAALAEAAGPQDAEPLARVVAFDLAPGASPVATSVDGIQVEVVAIPHSGGADMADIDNLVFRVTLDAVSTVLHLGDAGVEDADFAGQQDHWDARHSHVAFPPYWFFVLEGGRSVLDERIRADMAVGVHVPARAIGAGDAWREQAGADLFTDPGETRIFAGDSACPRGD